MMVGSIVVCAAALSSWCVGVCGAASYPPTSTISATSTAVLRTEKELEDFAAVQTTTMATKSKQKKRLTEESMSPRLKVMEYAVRGKVVIAADRISSELLSGSNEYPFDHIVYTNVGNPHSVGQLPLTWPRQVLALCDLPDHVGVHNPHSRHLFPADAIARAVEIKSSALHHMGTGAYTHSQGPILFRKDIARFIERRDGLEEGTVDVHHLFMTNGASAGIQMILTALISDETSGVMIPTPQYPIYSATIDLLGGQKVGYYLDEKTGWGMNIQELERSLHDAKQKGIQVTSFVLINPGNPTGQVLSKEQVQDIVKFCAKHNLVLLADEVYQENVYDPSASFYSCRRAAYDTELIQSNAIELVSFHSTSKGLFGECGRRGGYMELVGFDEKVHGHLYKLASSELCSSVSGQIMCSLMVRGPEPGDVSYESHEAEKRAIYESLKLRANLVSEGLNAIPGFSCQKSQGAMYCFPAISLPPKAVEEANKQGIPPDTMYAVGLLERTGICVVPANGFGQRDGRYGFRTTFLPSEEELKKVVKAIRKHHEEFCARFE